MVKHELKRISYVDLVDFNKVKSIKKVEGKPPKNDDPQEDELASKDKDTNNETKTEEPETITNMSSETCHDNTNQINAEASSIESKNIGDNSKGTNLSKLSTPSDNTYAEINKSKHTKEVLPSLTQVSIPQQITEPMEIDAIGSGSVIPDTSAATIFHSDESTSNHYEMNSIHIENIQAVTVSTTDDNIKCGIVDISSHVSNSSRPSVITQVVSNRISPKVFEKVSTDVNPHLVDDITDIKQIVHLEKTERISHSSTQRNVHDMKQIESEPIEHEMTVTSGDNASDRCESGAVKCVSLVTEMRGDADRPDEIDSDIEVEIECINDETFMDFPDGLSDDGTSETASRPTSLRGENVKSYLKETLNYESDENGNESSEELFTEMLDQTPIKKQLGKAKSSSYSVGKTDKDILPEKYNEVSGRFGLRLCNYPMENLKTLLPEARLCMRQSDKMLQAETEMFPATCINRVSWNPNCTSYLWLASGYHCGIMRVPCIHGMHTLDVERTLQRAAAEFKRES